jgi:predicted membrane-bound mannosyltransferase
MALLFFSSFFHDAGGPRAAVQTYLPWLRRAEGATEHAHEWTFYFQRLLFFHSKGTPVWSEAFIVALAAVGFFSALLGPAAAPPARWLRRLIVFYTLCLTLIYTVLTYKTPWCLLGFYHGMILLAGIGAVVLWRACPSGWPRRLAFVGLAGGAGQLAWQAGAENFAADKNGVPYCDSAKSPYVYSQTVPDALRLVHTVEAIAQASPQRYDTVVEIMGAESYWPLPWYLRRFKNIGYWEKIPHQPLAPIMIVSTALHAAFDERPEKTHLMAGYFELRPGVFFELYVNMDLWRGYIKTQAPEDN